MNSTNKQLDEIFKKARIQEPKVSFAETSARFEATIATSGAAAVGLWISKLFSLKTGVFSTVAIGIVALTLFINKKTVIPETEKAVLEISPLDTVASKVDLALPQVILPNLDIDSAPPPKTKREQLISSPSIVEDSDSISSLLQKLTIVLPEIEMGLPADSLNLQDTETQSAEDTVDSIKTKTPELKSTQVQFTVTESTSTKELASISGQARKAGIEYTYIVDLKRKLIREFNVNMAIDGTRVWSDIKVSVPKKGKFEVKFGWTTDENGKAIKLSDDVTIAEAIPKHPLRITTARAVYQSYLENGLDHIEQNFDKLTTNSNSKDAKENILNRVGYLFLQESAYEQAIEIFELNTRLFPNKANPWDSLGEAYYKSGDKQRALAAFKKALSIDRKLSSSRDWVKKIEAEQ